MKLFVLIALLSTTLCATICTGCGGGSSSAGLLLGEGQAKPHFDTQAIAAIASTPAPDGVDQALWRELATVLADALADRQLSDAPAVEGARVNDLAYTLTAGPRTSFTWSYRNPGDYDLNGEVNVSDIAQIVRHYLASSDEPDWASAQVADGDGNGEVNVADISAIVQNYLAVVSGYTLQTSTTASEAQWTDVGQVELAGASIPDGGGMPRFTLELAPAVFGNYYRVVPFERTTSGELVRTNTGATGVPVLFSADARGDWHSLGRDAQHTSLSTHEGPTTNHVYWKHEIGGSGKSSPVYNSAGTIYVGGGDGLYTINPDHTSVAVYLTPDTVETTPAIAKDGTVYFGCNDGVFRALNPGGDLKWSFTAGAAIRSSPVAGEDGTVFFGCDDRKLYVLAADGSLKWTFEGEQQIRSSPRLSSEGYVFVYSRNGAFELLYPDGQKVFEWGSGVTSNAPPLFGYFDYTPSQWENPETAPENPIETYILRDVSGLSGYPADPNLPELASPLTWTYPPGMISTFITPSFAPDGGLHVRGAEDDHGKYDKNRNLEWVYNFDDQFFYDRVSASVDSRGKTYFGGSYKGLVALNADGSKLWKWVGEHASTSQVTIANSTLFFVNSAGWLYALGGLDNGRLPDVPEGLYAEKGKSTEEIDLSWDLVNGASKYEIYRDTQSNLVATVEADEWNRGRYTDTDVTTGSLHEYWVRAVNIAGQTDFTEGVLGWTSLERPENVAATDGVHSDRIVLNWDPVQNATSYRIRKDNWGGSPETIVEGQTTWTDEVTDWDTHSYSVLALNNVATSSSSFSDTGFAIRGIGDSGAGSWNQYKANAGNTNLANNPGPTVGSFAWANQADPRFDLVRATPAMFGSEGAIFVPERDYLVCFNPDGSLRWSAESDSYHPVITADGSIATTRYLWNERNLVILNSDGTDQLVSNAFSPRDFSISGDGSLLATEDFAVVSFNVDASINWRYDLEDHPADTPPVISPNGTIYFLSYYWNPLSPPGAGESIRPMDLNALNPDGTLRWVKPFDDRVDNLVVGPDEKIYLRDSDNDELVALNPDASIAWTKPYPELSFQLAVDAAGSVYVMRSDRSLDVLFNDGTLKWSNNFEDFVGFGFNRSPVIDSNGNIFLQGTQTFHSVVIAFDQDGVVKWEVQRSCYGLGELALDGFGRLIFCGREVMADNQINDLFCIGPPL